MSTTSNTSGDGAAAVDEQTGTEWELARSEYGGRVHLVEFDSDTLLALAKGKPDRLLCGKISDCERVDGVEGNGGFCKTCYAVGVERGLIPADTALVPDDALDEYREQITNLRARQNGDS